MPSHAESSNIYAGKLFIQHGDPWAVICMSQDRDEATARLLAEMIERVEREVSEGGRALTGGDRNHQIGHVVKGPNRDEYRITDVHWHGAPRLVVQVRSPYDGKWRALHRSMNTRFQAAADLHGIGVDFSAYQAPDTAAQIATRIANNTSEAAAVLRRLADQLDAIAASVSDQPIADGPWPGSASETRKEIKVRLENVARSISTEHHGYWPPCKP